MRSHYWKALLHVLAWSVFLFLPAIAAMTSENPHFYFPFRDVWRTAILCGVFYLNYLVLIPQFFLKSNKLVFILINVALVFFVHSLLHHSPPPPMPPDMMRPPRFHGRPIMLLGFSSFMLVFLTVGMALATKMTEQWFKHQKEIAQKETEHLKSELSYLKLQISPHFLLNTLNNIYSLTIQDTSKAQKALLHLGKLLRYLLYETEAERVSLRGEIAFMKSYIELMQLRSGPHVHVEVTFDEPEESIKVAPLLFLPLVENAFKHGIHPSKDCSIHLSLAVMDGRIVFSTENSNHPKSNEDRSGSGVGLTNLKKRLELIYPHKHSYNTHIREDVFTSLLEIEVHHG